MVQLKYLAARLFVCGPKMEAYSLQQKPKNNKMLLGSESHRTLDPSRVSAWLRGMCWAPSALASKEGEGATQWLTCPCVFSVRTCFHLKNSSELGFRMSVRDQNVKKSRIQIRKSSVWGGFPQPALKPAIFLLRHGGFICLLIKIRQFLWHDHCRHLYC